MDQDPFRNALDGVRLRLNERRLEFEALDRELQIVQLEREARDASEEQSHVQKSIRQWVAAAMVVGSGLGILVSLPFGTDAAGRIGGALVGSLGIGVAFWIRSSFLLASFRYADEKRRAKLDRLRSLVEPRRTVVDDGVNEQSLEAAQQELSELELMLDDRRARLAHHRADE